jgi:hypothetical protein
VAASGAFDPDGERQVIIAILAEGEVVAGGRPAIEQEHGRASYAKRIRRAAHGTNLQAELLKRL